MARRSLLRAWLFLTAVGLYPAFAGDLGLDRLEHYTSRDGLSQDWVLHLYQDRQGFLWISTDDGLNRFDGYRFKVYRNDPEDSRSLAANFVTGTYQDRHGDLWVATAKGLHRHDRARDDFTRFGHHEERPDSLSSDWVAAVVEDGNGALWVATMDGVNRFDRATGTFQRFHHDPEAPESLSDDTVYRMHRGSGGDLWLGAADGTLHRWDDERGSFRRYPLGEDGATIGVIWEIVEDAEGHLWIGAEGGALISFDPATERRARHRLDASDLNAILVRPDGSLWLGTELGGVLVLEPETGAVTAYRHDPGDPGSPGSNRVMDLLEDRGGVVWLATEAGLDKLDPSRQQFAHYRHRSDDDDSLSDDLVFSVLEDRRGDLWVGTASGLDRLDRERGANTRYRHDRNDPESMARQVVLTMLEDSDGSLWFGTHRGIARFDQEREAFVHIEPDPDDPDSLIEGWVYDIVEGRQGVLWIGGIGGLNRYATRERHLTRYRYDPQRQEGLGSDTAYDLHYDRHGNLWLGMADSGLSLLRGAAEAGDAGPGHEVLRHFRHDPADSSSLSSDVIGAIHEDRAGRLWIGTLGGGLNRLDFEAPGASGRARFTHFRENDGLANDNILAILEDEDGNLWLSSHRGLTRFDPSTGGCKSYDHVDGLQSNAFTFHAATRTAAGELLFGGPFGLNAFFPDRLRDDPHPPPVAITDFRLFNRPVPFAERSQQGRRGGERAGEERLVLTHRDRIFGFEFAALHFAKPSKNRYRYRLQGFSREWVETDAGNRFAQYTDLDVGDYRFRVQAANPDGVWSEQGASVPITVLPPPWKTWWAYSLYVLALAAVVAAYVRLHRRELRRERQISRRLRAVDRLKDEFLANTSHELRTPLYGMTGLAESLIDGAEGELSEGVRTNLSMIVASGRRLSHLVNDILDFSKLRHQSLELRRGPVDLRPLTEVVLTMSRPLVGSKVLDLVNTVPADLPAADADEDRLQQILYNLVGNAIKFTESGTVEVSASRAGDLLEVRVVDTGIGIPESAQERIFDAFEQADAAVDREHGGTGLGLAVTRQLVELHGGTIRVESAPGAGSTFSFSLKVAPAASSAKPPPAVEPTPIRDGAGSPIAARAPLALAAGPRVLVVDDEPVNLQVLRNYLAVEDFQLTLASSGDEALRLLEEQTFDLVLLDVMMPRVSGYEVCKVLRESHALSDLPVIFLTARNQDSDVVAGMSLGANDYLTKPISKDRLLARVRPHLDLLHTHRNLEELVEEKMSEIKVLEGILPICAGCKKIRDDDGIWNALEVFIDSRSEATFSHGMCPECVERYRLSIG